MKIKLSIYRFNPDSDKQHRYDKFEIESEPGETVLSALIRVKEDYDPSLGFRFACGKVKCGECSIMVNKVPCLACNKKIEPEMVIEPLPNIPIIKDLVIDRNRVINKILELAPSLLGSNFYRPSSLKSNIINNYIKLTSCFECLICQSVCNVFKDRPEEFIGPLGLLWVSQVSLMNPNIREEMLETIRMCLDCGLCWRACPSEIKFLEDAIKGLLDGKK